jgi:hypothetical protein
MHEALEQRLPVSPVGRPRSFIFLLLVALALMLIGVISLFFLVFGSEYSPIGVERPYLIPWVLATGVVIAIPCVALKRSGEFKFTNPLAFAALTYFFPMFFLGGWSLTLGLSNYYFLNYVADPQYNFPLTFVYIMLGFAGLSLGYFIPKGKSIGNYFSAKLPKWEFTPTEIVIACVFCLIAGFCVNIIALEIGQIGYQAGDIEYGDTGSLASYLATLLPASSFLLWIAFFKFERWNFFHFVIVAAQVITAVFMLVVQGGKSSLLYFAVLAIGAFVLVRKKIEAKHWGAFAGALVVCLLIGTFYGTKFRELKGTANRVSFIEYSTLAFESIGQFGDADPLQELTASGALLADRLEIVSAFAVVVSNYEALSAYEAAYGLDNSIWTYTWTAFIPRILWKDKPIVADNYSYNELYFDHGGFGLSLTAMGDLLRNFGPIGVPIGMIVLGFGIRIFYSMLVEGVPFSIWKATVYFIVITKVSYDGFYGEILPIVIRVSAVIFVQFLMLRAVARVLRSMRS